MITSAEDHRQNNVSAQEVGAADPKDKIDINLTLKIHKSKPNNDVRTLPFVIRVTKLDARQETQPAQRTVTEYMEG